jgi:hypothetical protein
MSDTGMRRPLVPLLLLPLASFAALAACSDTNAIGAGGAGNARSAAQAIVNGTVDTTRPDVLLLQDDTAAGFRCTATLIAPNLVVTARHCVGMRASPPASTLCQGDGTTNGAQPLPDYAGDFPAAPMVLSDKPGGTILARGMTVYDDNSTTTCAHDLALIALDRNVAGITPSEIRRTPLAVSDVLVAMGFGWTNPAATINATERMRGDTSVLALGPVVVTFKPFGDAMSADAMVAAAGGEIVVQGITMTGDSGGPAFDSAGRIAAVISRGYNDATYGPGTFTTLAAHLAIIDAALAATGNTTDGGVDTLPDALAPKPDAGGALDASRPLVSPDAAEASATGTDPGFGRPVPGCAAASSMPARGSDLGAMALVAALAWLGAKRRRHARAWA